MTDMASSISKHASRVQGFKIKLTVTVPKQIEHSPELFVSALVSLLRL